MTPARFDRVLLGVAVVHLIVAVAAGAALVIDAPPVLGLHPAVKPLKFGVSIAVFLATMAYLVPRLSLADRWRRGIAATLAVTMLAEIVPIVVQAVLGATSHFNQATPFDAALWRMMIAAITIATLTMVAVALVATVRPLRHVDGAALDAYTALAWRAGLWMLVLAAISGFAMGGRLAHSVGGTDGGPGLPVVNWSARHGDLRVSHFVALHALQSIPLLAALLGALRLRRGVRWISLLVVIAAHLLVAVGALVQALAARPVW